MSTAQWKNAIEADFVEPEDLVGVTIDGREIAVYNLGGKYYATDNVCTHEDARLSDGFVVDDVIECPVHQGRFHIPTGKPKGAPVHIWLRTYPVKLENGCVYVQLEDGQAPASGSCEPASCPAAARKQS